jgi:amino acid adenylation domain-containing protein
MTYDESKRPQLSAAKRALLEKRLKGRRISPTPDQLISSRTARESAPLSFAQQRLWFLWQMDPEGFAYNVSAAFRLKGQLDLKALERSFNEIIRRHESLRTSFRVVNAEPRQIISPALVVPIPLEDLQHLPEDARRREAMRLASESSQQPFDLERLPLLRIRVLRLSADEHVLLVVMHHIVTDGWSQGLMVEELGTLYQAYSRGRESTLAELEIQYGDYAEWQRGWLSGEVLEEQVGYWKKQLSGSRFMLELPTDHIRPPVQTQRGTQITFDLSPEVSEKLRALSREHEVTLFMTLLAVFQVLLSRYTHQADIIVGTPIANRTRREIENLIGFFVNTLVLRSDLSGAPSFRELLHRVGEMTEAAYAHQDVPFEKLVEELQPDRDMSRSPLFQVMFALQNAPMQSFELPGLNLGPMEFEHGATGFDLECHLWEYEQSIRGMLVYSTDLFEEATMRRLIRHFQTLLDEIIAQPDERITRLQMLTRAEERQLLDDWNDTTTETYAPAPAHQLFAAQAATTPDHIALRFDEAALTYSELNARANRLAHYLRRRGIGAESIVGICLERSMEMIISVLGVLKAGGAYLPLDPDYPSERLAFMIEDARASLLLTQENLRERLSDAGTEIISLEHLADDLSSESTRNPHVETTSDNLAYVIYTSGSTGRPKGVMMPHGPLVNLLRYQIERSARVCHAPRTLQFASLSFDVSFQEIFTTLCAGGELLLIREDERRDISALLRLLRGAQVERLFLPFVALQHLAETSERESLLPASLREVITAGEQLKVTPYLKSMFEKLEGCVLDNQYGPSESHVASAFRLDGETRHWPELPPIGQAIANTQLYALDEEMQLVPAGVTGELFIGGDCLSRGYLHRAGATAEKFIPHPFSKLPGARLYRTGDLVRRLPDGELEFLGRVDSQVKMRGYRIEPGEVEAALALHPAVSEAVVMIHTDGTGERRLVAYVVGAEQGLSTGELRQFMSGKLPDYMVPSAFMMLDQFPLTPSGKVNRRALPVPEMLPFEREMAYVAPRTRTEKMMAEIWAEVLGIKQVGIEDNFFALGGHSLLATQVLSRARQAFQVEIPLRHLFKQPTIESLAQYIEAKAQEGAKIPQPVAVRQSGETLPLSFAQQRLWFIDQLFPQSAAYNLPSALRLEGALDLAALQRSFNEIIRRHESLRTTFSQGNGRAVQVVAEKTLLDIPLLDLRTLAPEQRDAETVRLASEEAQRPFDLQRGPPVRALLLRLEEREHILLVTMHHIVTDGWSLGILVRELGVLYQAYSTGQEPMLADLSLQYGDYAEWQREWMSGERLERELEYWRRQLSGSSLVLELPTDRARPPVQRQSGAQVSFAISEETTRKLYELSHDEDVTLFMTLLAAFQVLLSRYTHQPDIIVGSPIANRTRSEVEDLIGFFVNTLVLRTDLSGNPEFRELLRRVREVTLGGYEHQDVPFEKLVEELQPERSLGHMPLVQVIFALQNAPQDALEWPGLTMSGLEADNSTAKFDLVLNVSEIGEQLGCALRYSTDLFDPATMKRMLGHFQTLLTGIVNHPDCRINALPLLSEDERRKLLNEWRPLDARRFPQDATLHQMFEAQVEQRPTATALVFGDERLSYAELNRRANRLAHYLRMLGVGPESRVGLLLERSTEMVVALLAILKAGGAYVPFDSSYPQERLDFMLRDAGLSVLLTVRKLADGLSQPNMRVMLLDDDAKEVALQPEHNPQGDVMAENLAYVIYTSGSTGQPKGVLVSHAQVARLFKATEEWFNFDEQDVWTLFHSYAFDFSVWELWGALLYGGKLVIVSYEVSREPEEFYRLLCREAVTVLNQTPSAFRQLIAAEQSLGFNNGLALRLVIFGGEALELHTLKPWFELHGDEPVRLVNMYGITETTVHVTYRPLTMADVHFGTGSRIGRPMPDLQVYVLDRELQPVPVGIEGEMYIGGDGLARGYHNRPELSAERFVPDPFDARGGARLYRSGDLARYLASGDLEYTGRGDQQVKIRGYRIELGEIETALAGHESVSQAVVIAREDTPGDKRLIAYLLTRNEDEETSPGVEELQNFLRERLPEQMIPAAFVMLDALPLTAHGKIDRRALPAPGHERPQLEQAYRPPHGTLEMLLAEMWREVLGVGQIGAEDNFFNLGGDSIKGAVFINRLQERLGEIVHVVTIFNHSTIRGLAQYLEDQYAEAVARVCGKNATARAGRIDGTTPEAERVDERRIAEARLIITPLPARAAQEKNARSKNSQAIFVLSAPRSGSTLFRVMLAGHPKLFAPPELELLSFNTLEERQNAFTGGDSFWLEGALRAIMEIKGYDAAQAKSIMQAFEERRLTTQEFYRQMQSWLGDRRLVDKTPSYALHPSILQRAEEDFDDALYIHLLRHPLGMIRSFEEAKLDQIFFRYEHPFSRKELAELIWLISNQNILNFLSRIPARRHHRVRFEDLLDQPENIMREVCEFLGINLHPDMLQPYKDKERRMTDGIHAESRMLGDVKFHQYTGIDARAASRWQEYATDDSLGHPTLELANTLGYKSARRPLKNARPPVSKTEHAPQSSPPVINIQTGGAKRPLFFVHPGAGDPSDYIYLSRRLGEEQPFYGLPGFDSQRPDASIEEKAAQSISALREIQPAGPYLLGGWSFGALIAFEVAQQLRRSGEGIALLTLLDPMSPSTAASSNAHNLTVTSDPLSAAVEIAALIGWDAEELFANLAQVGPTMQLGVLYEQAQTTSLLPPGVTLKKFSDWLLMYHAKLRCALSYRPQTYPLKINIFQASDEPFPQDGSAPPEDIDKPFEIWRRLSSQPVNLVLVPGSHHTMVQEPHVEVLAAHLKSILETASLQL